MLIISAIVQLEQRKRKEKLPEFITKQINVIDRIGGMTYVDAQYFWREPV